MRQTKIGKKTLCTASLALMGGKMKLESMSDAEVLGIANPIMDNLMDASTAIDHEPQIRDFTVRMKSIVAKEYLQRVCEHYQWEKESFAKREPVAVFRRLGAVGSSGNSGERKLLESSLPKCFSWRRTESLSLTTPWCSER